MKTPRSIVRTESGRLSRTFLLHLLGALSQATTLFAGLLGILPPVAATAVSAALYVVQTAAAFILRRFTTEAMKPKPPKPPRKRARKIVAASLVLCSLGALVGCGALLSSLGAKLDEEAKKLDFDCAGDATVELQDRAVVIRCSAPGSKVPTIVVGADRVVGP